MSYLRHSDTLLLPAALAWLKSKVETSEGSPGELVRLECATEDAVLLEWLAAQECSTKTYWADRDGSFATVGIGTAAEIVAGPADSWSSIIKQARDIIGDTPARFYGGRAFGADSDSPDSSWQHFGHTRFQLPVLELSRRDGTLLLACNSRREEQESLQAAKSRTLAVLDSITPAVIASTTLDVPLDVSLTLTPDRQEWQSAVDSALTAISDNLVEKVVLAACSRFDYRVPLDPIPIIAKLDAVTQGCYRFCFQVDTHEAFLGATPELLCHRQGNLLKTEAIAGTRRRGDSVQTEAQLADDLLNSAKERREHQFVVDFLKDELADSCTNIAVDTLSVLKLPSVQHLCVHVSGQLNDGVGDADLLSRLHPTPAVGGWPREQAAELIAELEPFARGWYAGPVGWIGADAVQFAVGIRSGLVQDQSLRLYAGAGIVQGSDAELEWQEIEDKMNTFQHAVGIKRPKS